MNQKMTVEVDFHAGNEASQPWTCLGSFSGAIYSVFSKVRSFNHNGLGLLSLSILTSPLLHFPLFQVALNQPGIFLGNYKGEVS